jgi:cytosine deaminase
MQSKKYSKNGIFHDLLAPDSQRSPHGRLPTDVLVQDGRIAAARRRAGRTRRCLVEDGQGALLLPGLVEGHTHLDKTMWGMDWYRNEVGTNLIDKIENERAFRHASGHDAAAQSLVLAKAFLALGTTRLRTHVDVDTQAGLRHLEGTVRTRERRCATCSRSRSSRFPSRACWCGRHLRPAA